MGKFFCDKAARCISCGEFLRATDIARNDKHLYPIGTLFTCPCGKAEVWTNSIRDEEALVAFIAGESRRYYQGFCCDLFDGKGNVVQPIRSAEWEGEEQRGQILGSKQTNGRVREFAIAWRSRFLPEGEDATEALIAWYEKNLGAVKALVREAQATPNKSAASPLDNPAFRNWFGDSKVVDEDGEPLVVYHGTDKSFDVFKTRSKSVDSTTFGPMEVERSGIFLSDNAEFSREFGRRLLPLYARIEDPVEVTLEMGFDFSETIEPHGPDRDLWLLARHLHHPWQLFNGELGTRFVAYLKELGHDGATFEEEIPKGESGQEYVEGRTYVVFDPRQIKSATDNDGSFDLDDPDFTSNGRTFTPPAKVAAEARYGLELRAAQPPSNRCCTDVGIRRAVQLANRQPVSVETLKRMRSYFQRHAVDKRGRGWGVSSKGFQAWLLWGGDSGEAWCNRILDELGA